MKEKEILANNRKLAEADGYKVIKSIIPGILQPSNTICECQLDYHKSWDKLIPLFNKVKETNALLIHNEPTLRNFKVNFLLGVSLNEPLRAFKTLAILINHKEFKK